MILGVGTDIVGVARIKSILERWGPRFFEFILAPEERVSDANQRPSVASSAFLSKRFAGKEAIVKALGLWGPTSWHDWKIMNDAYGKPEVLPSAKALEWTTARFGGPVRWHISLSDERDTAVAVAVLER